MKHVVIIGGGFAGINAAKQLGRSGRVSVTIIDQRNHHLFQPLLYQVAMAGLDPSDIATPIRSLMRSYPTVQTLLGRVDRMDLEKQTVCWDADELSYDYLIVACGASHSYFGNTGWESYAPGLKSLGQATEIRRRVLLAFEEAERTDDPEKQSKWMTFVIIGGGPTGVELAGAIAEMARFALVKDFRTIDASQAKVILVQSGPRILKQFDADQAAYATESLQKLGVEVRTESRATNITADGIQIGDQHVAAKTVLWAAGVQANSIGTQLKTPLDRAGRVYVESDLALPQYSNVFVAGDLAHFKQPNDTSLPGLAPVAIQQGRYLARLILKELASKESSGPLPRLPFVYNDKGQMATIGRKRAVLASKRFKKNGFVAWLAWLVIHLYYLSSFRNRIFVFFSWCWSYLTFSKGARLIVQREWRQQELPVSLPPVSPKDSTALDATLPTLEP